MSEVATPDPLTLSARIDQMFPTLAPDQVERIARHGRVRSVEAGEVLVAAGSRAVPFFVVRSGEIEIVPYEAPPSLPPARPWWPCTVPVSSRAR